MTEQKTSDIPEFKEYPYKKDITIEKVLLSSLEAFTPEHLDRIEKISGTRFDPELMKKAIIGVNEALKDIPQSTQMYVISLMLVGMIFNAKLGQFDHTNTEQIGWVFDSYMDKAFIFAQVSYIQCYWCLENRVTN